MLNSRGGVNTLLVIVLLIFFAFFGSSLLTPRSESQPLPEASAEPEIVSGSCCANAECTPVTGGDNDLTFNGKKYGLLKSNIKFREGNYHLKDSGEKHLGNPIILNSTDEFIQSYPYPGHNCGHTGNDQIWGPPDMGEVLSRCVAIPDDVMVYVCKENCVQDNSLPYCGSVVTCYGTPDSVFDVYYRIGDYEENGIPDIIKQCKVEDVAQQSHTQTKKEYVFPEEDPSKPNLQLKNFKIVEIQLQPGGADWMSPWCKPAIYLYPEQKTDINVKVNSNFPLSFTLPKYPQTGWNVTAYPDGQLLYQNAFLDYLYYETRIPDELIKAPTTGFIVENDKLEEKLNQILPKLGLNPKESRQFKEYWLKSLPKSNYYQVSILPDENINTWAPLEVTPSPKTSIRVTLYFKALDEKVEMPQPTIVTPKRDGYTLIEWGGVFKGKPGESFSCLM